MNTQKGEGKQIKSDKFHVHSCSEILFPHDKAKYDDELTCVARASSVFHLTKIFFMNL